MGDENWSKEAEAQDEHMFSLGDLGGEQKDASVATAPPPLILSVLYFRREPGSPSSRQSLGRPVAPPLIIPSLPPDSSPSPSFRSLPGTSPSLFAYVAAAPYVVAYSVSQSSATRFSTKADRDRFEGEAGAEPAEPCKVEEDEGV